MSDTEQEHTICYRQHRLWISVCGAQDKGLLQGWHLKTRSIFTNDKHK